MQELATTFDAADLSSEIFQGIAGIYRLLADHPITATSPEGWRRSSKSSKEVVSLLFGMEE